MKHGDRRRCIDDYGFLSDCHTAALVDRRGSIDWWCPSRFDAPSVFGRLLGPDAGHWSLHPSGEFESTRRYVGATLVVRTTFVTDTGEVDVTDALALEPRARGHDIGRRAPHVLLRRVEGRRGTVAMTTELAPRMEYGLTSPHLTDGPDGLVARGGPVTLSLRSDVALIRQDATAGATFTVQAFITRQCRAVSFRLVAACTICRKRMCTFFTETRTVNCNYIIIRKSSPTRKALLCR